MVILETESVSSDASAANDESFSAEEAIVDTESDSDSDVDIDVAAGRDDQLGSLAKQVKIANEELQKLEDEEEDESGDTQDDGEDMQIKWGSRKQYYGTNITEEGEDKMEEVEEAVQHQKAQLRQLNEEDFDIPAPASEDNGGGDPNLLNKPEADDQQALISLYTELKTSLQEVKSRIGPLLEQARKEDVCTAEGLSYLEVKHLLLLHYSTCIVYYLLMKLEGRTVKDHPVLLRLVEIRAYLEKLRPIESRLKPQVDKLLTAVTLAKDEEDDAMEEEVTLAPRPEELLPKMEKKDEVYHPPKLHAATMDTEPPEKKKRRKSKKKEKEDAMISEIVQEMTGAPEERPAGQSLLNNIQTILSDRQRLEQAEDGEEYYNRFSSGKASRKLAANREGGKFGGVSFDQFAEEVEETVSAIESSLPAHAPPRAIVSGDADVPTRERKKRPQLIQSLPETVETASVDKERKTRKKDGETKQTLPPKPDKKVSGRRGISDMIQKNRGLTPHRSRDRKNPRRRHRLQFENKEKRRKGQIQKGGGEAPDYYGGEASGISKRVKKSVRFV